VWRLDRSAAIDVYNQLAELHEGWLAVVADVRQLYRSIGTPESEWLVRPSASARPRSLDPDIDGLCDRYTRLCRSMTFAPIGWQEIAAQWRARGRR
jgi:hypothetical protein